MGYQAEKNKIEKKIYVIKRVLLWTLVVLLLGLCVFAAFCPPDTWKYYVNKPDVGARKEGELRIHFLDVGQGDCTLIELPDGKVVMIDGGDIRESTATAILRYLNALDIDAVDHLVVTHADADHCGSLTKILEEKEILNAYLPTVDPENAGSAYAAFYAALLEEHCTRQYASQSIVLGNSSYTLSFLYPYTLDANESAAEENEDADSNALSSVLWLDYVGTSALFTGDAPKETENLLMRDDGLGLFENRVDLKSTEILKVAHHGSADSTSLEFLRYLQVKTAVVSCGKNNLYGHPSDEVKKNLSETGVGVYRTDERGNVVITALPTGEYTVKAVA